MALFEQLQAQLNQPTTSGAGPSPFYDFPELSAMNATTYSQLGKGGIRGQLAGETSRIVEEQQRSMKAAQSEYSKGKYERVPNEVGGWTFHDPDGNAITAYDYSKNTGKSIKEVLSDSLDPGDMKFVGSYEDFQDLSTHPEEWLEKKVKRIDSQVSNAEITQEDGEARKEHFKQAEPQQILNELFQRYKHIFIKQ